MEYCIDAFIPRTQDVQPVSGFYSFTMFTVVTRLI